MKRPRILLADDHAVILDGLRSILEADFEIVGAVTDGRALVAACERLHPDVVLSDITMPLLNGLDAARKIKKADPRARIIFLTRISTLVSVLLTIGWPRTPLLMRVGKHSRR